MMKLKDKPDLPISKKSAIPFIQSEDISSSMKHFSSRGPVKRPQDMEQGGLSHAGGAYNGSPFPLEESEINPPEDFDLLCPVFKRLKELLNLNQFLHTMDSFACSTNP
jgi:hypothetical protein